MSRDERCGLSSCMCSHCQSKPGGNAMRWSRHSNVVESRPWMTGPRSRLTALLTASMYAVLLHGSPAAAQVPTGTISGRVVDESGAAIPGANVTLVNETRGDTRTAVTNDAGAFTFNAVLAGSYTVRVALDGFRTLERRNNVLNPSGHLSLRDLGLEVGAIAEQVAVVAQGATVETTNSDYSGLLTSTQIGQVQTKGRDVMTLLRLLPGVRYEDDIEAMGDSFGSNVPNMGGQRRSWNQVTVDGLNGNELSGTSRFASATNLDAIAEVKVLLGSYKAEYGRSGGSNVQVVTKSGGMEYHGNLRYYGRRDRWNENRWENEREGLPKPKQHFDTYGFTLGGPAAIPGLWTQNDKKVFFFYSLEAPHVQRPGALRRYLVPTDLERQGDFSRTLDTDGELVVVTDPQTGQPFPGNKVPADRIDPNGQALMNMLPQPNSLDRSVTGGNYNFVRQETSENPRWNHVVRVDWKPRANSGFWASFNTFDSLQRGSEITAGPEKWGFFNGTYDYGNKFVTAGHTQVFSANVVNELNGGVRRQTEGFGWVSDADLQRLRRADVGFNVGQFHPELNPDGLLPRVLLGAPFGGSGVSNTQFTYDNRVGATAHDWISSVQDTLTWLKGTHTFKAGFYVEYLRNNEARGGVYMGEFDFRRSSTNPLDTNYAFSNLLLGAFQRYTEVDAYRSTQNRRWQAEWYAQDSWRPNNRLTLDYGVRFLWYTPYWQANERTAAFVPERWDPARAPQLYQPAVIDDNRVAYDPVTGETLPEIFVGGFVPGTGDPANGMVPAGDPDYPRGFREQLGPQVEPRLGLAYDLFGDGRTAVHASAGLFHHAVLGGGSQGNLQGPPNFNEGSLFFNTLSDFLEPGATLAQRPASVRGLERDAKTPSAIRFSAGVRRELGWGTSIDASYVGALNRHLDMERNINEIPPESRFLDLHPENEDPRTGEALPSEFLRPFRGYQDIRISQNWGTGTYHSLQVQVNRRYIRGVQFSGAYTYARAYGPGSSVSLFRPLKEGYWAPIDDAQTHNLVVSYTWDLPDGSTLWDSALGRSLLDDWQLSGEGAWVSGDWTGVELDTTDDFNFTGGQEDARPVLVGDPELSRSERDPLTGWFNTNAFARPSGRGDLGNSPRTVLRQPGVNNWNLAIFKNFRLGAMRSLQFRLEAYNVFNTLQFREVDTDARFDPDGNQVNENFGKATTSRRPRELQMSLRFSF
ncbi:MAG: TonB-dependent receptor plug domain-containing protein [Luteitalea sp.]|nr:TonB-dependent receptor plug domain-containing protein [Luteitalea sp.]